ncbi:MAG: phage tail tape measure protein [Verrucomicrobiales bacterium]|nr:phage tail tape measure protein [Verrucomicrobiales bacterium]
MAHPKIEIEVSARGVRTVQQRLQGLLTGVKSWAVGVGGALAAALGTREVLRQLDGAVDAIDKIGADAQRVGVLPETLSTLGHAAGLSKSNSEELQKSLEKLGRSISEAGDGVTTYTDAFSKLGVEVRNADGTMRSTGEVFFDLADAFQKLPDGPQKTALAMDLLGKSGAKLIPMLNQGSAAIQEMQEEARAFGLEVDGNAAKAAGDFNDNLDRLKAAAKGLWQTVAQDLLPILVQLTKQVVQSVKEGGALLTLAHGIATVLKTIIRLSIQTWEG